jgi:hypothetical protein
MVEWHRTPMLDYVALCAEYRRVSHELRLMIFLNVGASVLHQYTL